MNNYRYATLCICFLSLSVPLFVYGADAPLEFGGLKLGTDITEYPHLEYSNFLKDVVVTDWNGFAKGMISYGVCRDPGKIVKIRFKYMDTSKKFYRNLLKRYKEKFGKPGKWEGDAFGIQHIWKWTFVDGKQNRVVMIMQHNLKDAKLPIGTVVTLSYPDLIERERACFDKAHALNIRNVDHSNCTPNCPMQSAADPNLFVLPE